MQGDTTASLTSELDALKNDAAKQHKENNAKFKTRLLKEKKFTGYLGLTLGTLFGAAAIYATRSDDSLEWQKKYLLYSAYSILSATLACLSINDLSYTIHEDTNKRLRGSGWFDKLLGRKEDFLIRIL